MNRKPYEPDVDEPERACSSPPCYAAEFPGYFGEADAEVVARLNALLEAERAGARVLAILGRDLDRDSPARPLLARLQKDEGANAGVLHQTIVRLGGTPSRATGDFVAKTLSIDGLMARLAFVNKGQAWVVRKIDELLPMVADAPVRAMLEAMRNSHLDNVVACEAFIAAHSGNP
jgi:uncharacterized protein DUF6306